MRGNNDASADDHKHDHDNDHHDDDNDHHNDDKHDNDHAGPDHYDDLSACWLLHSQESGSVFELTVCRQKLHAL